uniref:SDR family oxidoreductase n=1 Tax=Acinetobacter sp. TaxID=472 RepID=UPI0038902125
MKIILTGSLGHIGKPLATTLVQKGHSVTVITSKAERKNEIENIGAKAAVGCIDNVDFLTETFIGADIVYLMEPPINFLDAKIIMDTYWQAIAKSYVEAILNSGVTKVIHLSSIGAHTDKGVGMLAAHYWVENILKELPHTVSIKTMRPVGFYYNMF